MIGESNRLECHQDTSRSVGGAGKLPEFIDGVIAKFVEFDLLGEDVERNVDGSAQPPAALIVVEDGVETGPVAIEEVLVAQRIEIAYTSCRIP